MSSDSPVTAGSLSHTQLELSVILRDANRQSTEQSCRPDYQNHENQPAGFACQFSANILPVVLHAQVFPFLHFSISSFLISSFPFPSFRPTLVWSTDFNTFVLHSQQVGCYLLTVTALIVMQYYKVQTMNNGYGPHTVSLIGMPTLPRQHRVLITNLCEAVDQTLPCGLGLAMRD